MTISRGRRGGRLYNLRPLAGRLARQAHLLLWTEPDSTAPPARRQSQGCLLTTSAAAAELAGPWQPLASAAAVADLLDAAARQRGPLTVWLPGGWECLVASRLTELIDDTTLPIGYATLQPERVLLKGSWRGRAITITSLGSWTGAGWGAWPRQPGAEPRQHFLDCILAIAATCLVTRCAHVCHSAGRAGLEAWRSWLGPRLTLARPITRRGGAVAAAAPEQLICPIVRRPDHARCYERHALYGMSQRHLCRGRVSGPIYELDLAAAYLSLLASAPVPGLFLRRLRRPSPAALAAVVDGHFCVALVAVNSPQLPFPLRRGSQPRWARGRFWTWLCGSELLLAVHGQLVEACDTALLYSRALITEAAYQLIRQLTAPSFKARHPLVAAAWRSMYCQLVGGLAGLRRVWRPAKDPAVFGPWAQWRAAHAEQAGYRHLRAIAGRVEELHHVAEHSAALPLVMAGVTSSIRVIQLAAVDELGLDDVLAVRADALWVTAAGLTRWQKAKADPASYLHGYKQRAVFDEVDFLSETTAIVTIAGQRFLRVNGVPGDIPADDAGAVVWRRRLGLADLVGGLPAQTRGSRRAAVKLGHQGAAAAAAAQRLPLADALIDPIVHQSLTEPWARGVDDADEPPGAA